MSTLAARFVLFLVLVSWASTVSAQSFSGPYVGVEGGVQHIIGGSLVDGIDTLQDGSRAVVSGIAGWRVQTRKIVFGGELGRGWTDGDLQLAGQTLAVDYHNSSQWHWGLHGGYAIADRTLIFGYLSEVTRAFDVTITQSGQTTTQQDEQGMLRFGAGVEQRLGSPLHLRVTAGTSRADFGGRATNIDVRRRFEIAAGIVFQF
jgi:hypothetical protein